MQFFERQPLGAIFLSASLLSVVISTGIWWHTLDRRDTAADELSALTVAHHRDVARRAAAVSPERELPRLPAFSSAELVTEFHTISAEVKLPLDEVSYSLDNTVSQPYLRYRVTLGVKTGYSEIRKFVAALLGAMDNVELDSIRCAREAAVSATLSCELTFSAFYRKGMHG